MQVAAGRLFFILFEFHGKFAIFDDPKIKLKIVQFDKMVQLKNADDEWMIFLPYWNMGEMEKTPG